MAELFQKDVRTINEHLGDIYDEDELAREATIRTFRIVRTEGLKGRVNEGNQDGSTTLPSAFQPPSGAR